ncbi:MAG: alpha/beta hydrolase [Candidatus Rokuibacteriota bacterium]|nr:MAG: alpha/beta hydrolase [Candidatus Rokubacteria bacterium]
MHHDHRISLRGHRFHYTEWGDPAAPPIVMLHGLTGHARTWDDEALARSVRHRVLALDQRGHGDSDPARDGDYATATLAEDLSAFADALGLVRFGVVALSMGGRVAIAYAGTHPARIDRLVIVDIGPDIAPAGRARVARMIAGSPERFATEEQALAYVRASNPRYTEALLERRVRHGLRRLPDGGLAWKYDPAIREAMRTGTWRDSIDLWPLLAKITCPTLIVRGAESDVLSPEPAKRMLEALPGARLVEVPEAGHTVPGDQPAAFQALLREFWEI